MTQMNWELRINGIRLSGDRYPSWDAATRAMFRELNRLHFHTEGADREHNGRCEAQLIATVDRMKRERPRGDISVKAMRKGKPWVLQVNRLPWGSAPSGVANAYLPKVA